MEGKLAIRVSKEKKYKIDSAVAKNIGVGVVY